MRNRYAKGFTIVELLVVIVVIAILAAITIVVYSGAQTKAENTKTTAAVTTYVRAIRSYATINETYPVTGAGAYACFGAPAGGKCGNVTGCDSRRMWGKYSASYDERNF